MLMLTGLIRRNTKKDIQNLYKSIGQKIRSVRKLKKMTLEDLAFKVDMDWSFLARIETGKAVASIETLYKICLALNIEMSYLFDNTKISKKEMVDKDLQTLLHNLSDEEKERISSIIKLILKNK